MKEPFRDKSWFPYTVTACIAVTLYVVLTHLTPVLSGIRTFLGYFSALFLGCVFAYLMNPLAGLYQRVLFRRAGKNKLGWSVSVGLAVLTVLLFVLFILGTLIPQMVESITMLVNNMDGYLASLHTFTQKLGIADYLKLDELMGASGDFVNGLLSVLKDNLSNILKASATAGKGLVKLVIAFIVSVYLLASKTSAQAGAVRFLRALLPEKRYQRAAVFLGRCDQILIRYIVFSLLDALIVGTANAIFMACLGMQYVGLISLVVAVTNLIPTFGPIVGYVAGGFILLLVNPIHAAIFVLFSLALQFLDGYVIKPKLFGNSLGVSGLLILAAVIVCGNMFGVLGMLLAIPLAAILDFVYRDAILPALEQKR